MFDHLLAAAPLKSDEGAHSIWRKNWSVGTAWVLGVSFMAEKAEKMIDWLFFDEIMNIWKSYMRIPWVPEVFSRMGLGASSAARAVKPQEKTSGAERFDLPCWMDLDLVSNLSIKSVVTS